MNDCKIRSNHSEMPSKDFVARGENYMGFDYGLIYREKTK